MKLIKSKVPFLFLSILLSSTLIISVDVKIPINTSNHLLKRENRREDKPVEKKDVATEKKQDDLVKQKEKENKSITPTDLKELQQQQVPDVSNLIKSNPKNAKEAMENEILKEKANRYPSDVELVPNLWIKKDETNQKAEFLNGTKQDHPSVQPLTLRKKRNTMK